MLQLRVCMPQLRSLRAVTKISCMPQVRHRQPKQMEILFKNPVRILLSVFRKEVHDQSSPSCLQNNFFRQPLKLFLMTGKQSPPPPPRIHGIKYLHSGIRNSCMHSDLCLRAPSAPCLKHQNQQLYLVLHSVPVSGDRARSRQSGGR